MSKQKQEIIPKAERVKRAQTKPFEIVQKKALIPSINGKNIFARLLVIYTG